MELALPVRLTHTERLVRAFARLIAALLGSTKHLKESVQPVPATLLVQAGPVLPSHAALGRELLQGVPVEPARTTREHPLKAAPVSPEGVSTPSI